MVRDVDGVVVGSPAIGINAFFGSKFDLSGVTSISFDGSNNSAKTRAVNILNADFSADKLLTKGSSEGVYISLSSGNNSVGRHVYLGDGSEINTRGTGLTAISIVENSTVTANNIKIVSTGEEYSGYVVDAGMRNGTLDLGKNSSIVYSGAPGVIPSQALYGVRLTGKTKFKAEDLSVSLNEVGTAFYLWMDSLADVDGLDVTVANDSIGFDIDRGSRVNVKDFNFPVLGDGLGTGIQARDGGSAYFDGGSIVTKGTAALIFGEAYANISNMFIGVSALDGADPKDEKDFAFGVYASGNGAKAELFDNVIDATYNGGKGAWALSADAGGIIESTGTTIKQMSVDDYGAAIYADTEGQVHLKGYLAVEADPVFGRTILVDGPNAKVTVDGLMNTAGRIRAINDGVIEINSSSGSTHSGWIDWRGRPEQPNDTVGFINWSGVDTVWNVTQDSYIDSLSFSGESLIDLAESPGYQNLVVSHFSGDARINFRYNSSTNESDALYIIDSVSGDHVVSLVDDASAAASGYERKNIIYTYGENTANFIAARDYEFGGYTYRVRENTDKVVEKLPDEYEGIDTSHGPSGPASPGGTSKGWRDVWEIYSNGQKSSSSQGSVGAVVGNYFINLAEQETLQDRMSTLRSSDKSYGTWARAYGGKYRSFSSHDLKGFDTNYSGMQVGLDGILSSNEYEQWLLGAAINYTHAKQDYRYGNGNQYGVSGNLYATYFNADDWYVDLYARYSHYRNKLDLKNSAGERVKGNGSANSVSLSAESGKRFYLSGSAGKDNAIYVEPNAQIIVGRIDSNKTKHDSGLEVKFDKQNTVIAKAGANIGYRLGDENPLDVYAKLDYNHEFDGKQKYKLNGSPEKLKFNGGWVTVGVGVNKTVKGNHNVFLEAEASNGNKFDSYSGNVGYRYRF